MSYSKFGRNSDVYAFKNAEGLFVCALCRLVVCSCSDPWPVFTAKTRSALIEHLENHRKVGDMVPEEAFRRIREEIQMDGETAEPFRIDREAEDTRWRRVQEIIRTV